MNRALTGLLLVCVACAASAAADPDEAQLRQLDQKCEEARAAKLAPIREELARKCEQEERYLGNRKRDCALEVSTYGDTFSGARGAAIRGKYYDLPECVAATNAWKKWEASRPWKN
jgi:hypothetical protein